MQLLSYQHTERSTISISLELFDNATFRLTREQSDGFGMEEEIINGTYIQTADSLTLKPDVSYLYSKYLTDLEPNQQYKEGGETLLLKKQDSGFLFRDEFLLKIST